MDGLRRVTFHFGGELEVRYLPEIPKAGDRVSHREELWLVSSVSQNGIGMIVVCEPPSRHDGHVRAA